MVQQSVALFTWLKIIPTLDAQHGNTGRQKRLGEHEKGLTALQEYKDEANILSQAYESVDALIAYLEQEKFDFWIQSPKRMERAREQGNEEDIGELISSIGRLLYKKQGPQETGTPPFPVCFHAYIFFLAVWELIYSVPISTNGKDIDFSILFEKSGRGNAGDNTGWVGISYDVAASGVFGDFRQVNDTPFWDVMLYIYKCRFEMLHNNKKQ